AESTSVRSDHEFRVWTSFHKFWQQLIRSDTARDGQFELFMERCLRFPGCASAQKLADLFQRIDWRNLVLDNANRVLATRQFVQQLISRVCALNGEGFTEHREKVRDA